MIASTQISPTQRTGQDRIQRIGLGRKKEGLEVKAVFVAVHQKFRINESKLLCGIWRTQGCVSHHYPHTCWFLAPNSITEGCRQGSVGHQNPSMSQGDKVLMSEVFDRQRSLWLRYPAFDDVDISNFFANSLHSLDHLK